MTSPIAAAVIADAARVLLIRRATPEGSLVWSFPGGKVDPGESPSEAAAREALEEVGVTVVPLRVLGGRVHPATGRRMVYVACRLLAGTAYAASPREVAEVRWVRLGEIPGLVLAGCTGRCRCGSTSSWRSSRTRKKPRPTRPGLRAVQPR